MSDVTHLTHAELLRAAITRIEMPRELRTLMDHNALDSREVQELKRLWWALHNTLRVWDFLDLTPAMHEVETLVRNLSSAS